MSPRASLEGVLRRPRYTLTAPEVHQHALEHTQRYLRPADHGRKGTAGAALGVLFWAAARLTSLAAACAALARAPPDQACRDALLATLPDCAELQRRLNRAPAGGLPEVLRKRPQRV